jgi:hypothetical protein
MLPECEFEIPWKRPTEIADVFCFLSFPSAYQRESNQRYLERKHKRKRGEKAKADANAVTDIAAAEAATSGLDEFVDGGE